MKNLFEAARVADVKERLGRLTPETERLWGTMSAAQAVAHCARGMEMAVGDRPPERLFLGRLIGRLIKPKVLGNDEPMRRNTPTMKGLVVKDDRDLAAERQRLSNLIDRFAAGGPAACTRNPHSFFGPMTPEEWAILMYKHIDHHLRQFGV
jgi:hypothetical protein